LKTSPFNPQDYGKIFSDLIDPKILNDLGSGQADIGLRDKISSVKLDQAFEPDQIIDRNYANACLSGIWLHHDFLDESHSISQNIPTTTGSFWHGIMHRREGDFWNSKYWFRQVKSHPVFSSLQNAVVKLEHISDLPEIHKKSWDPFLFVDIVEKYIGTGSEGEEICKKIQRLEWQILFDYCYRQTTGII
jgi:hypothetical protein